jgi:hypothetical protein
LTLGVVLSLTIPLAWLFACWRSGAPTSYLRELVFTQNVSRAAGEFGHRQPFFYYLLHLPVGFLPWTLFIPAAIVALRKTNPALLRKLVVWSAFVVVFFSIPSSKRNLYILLAMPALAMMIAAAWDDLIPSVSCRKTAMAVLATLAVGGAGTALTVLLRNEIPALADRGLAFRSAGDRRRPYRLASEKARSPMAGSFHRRRLRRLRDLQLVRLPRFRRDQGSRRDHSARRAAHPRERSSLALQDQRRDARPPCGADRTALRGRSGNAPGHGESEARPRCLPR